MFLLLECILFDTVVVLKTVIWQSSWLKILQSFPEQVRRDVGVELMKVQGGLNPVDWKPMPSVGQGVREIRDRYRSHYRVFYIAEFSDPIYVLSAFIKKTQRTPKAEINLARQRLRTVIRSRC